MVMVIYHAHVILTDNLLKLLVAQVNAFNLIQSNSCYRSLIKQFNKSIAEKSLAGLLEVPFFISVS